ncbi:aminotransferase class V-fold PLP-dependent enzyme [Gorillibacterium timonense]|uniref:aminotransferase class V-fold PLP-dependent enzyme n=1 Tax=Gorillibacterium timonense TaxID=1689269 RepID=UPI00292A4209|nr:aminotransferase class V-fold PLP-dependent enzyme [Gorillibacterium timonense]
MYLDWAASSWPKPTGVAQAMVDFMGANGANPGRGGHRQAMTASRAIYECRVELAKLFHVDRPTDIALLSSATEALNLAIKGFLKPGDHVISTELEHNSVRRPLEWVRVNQQVEVTYVGASRNGTIDLQEVSKAFRPTTKLFACSHASNLLGSVVPIAKIAEMCSERGVKLLVDAAQTAGSFPIDVNAMGIDMLAFPGHKGLLGPQGTGGLYIHPEIELEPLLHGGTGSNSEEVGQPTVRPERYEAGTRNTPGLVGLKEGVRFVNTETVASIRAHESKLIRRMQEGLEAIPGICCLGPNRGEERASLLAFVRKGEDPAVTAHRLDREYGIAVRAGYHCSPLGHQTAGTTETGAVRSSVGYATTTEQVDTFLEAIRTMPAK